MFYINHDFFLGIDFVFEIKYFVLLQMVTNI